MANELLNKSKWFEGEPIKGYFIITVDEVDPAIPSIDLLNANLEFIVKDDKSKPDSDSIALLTIGDGLTVVSNTSTTFNVIYEIPGSATIGLTPVSERDLTATLYFEIGIIYDEDTESDVLESGSFKINLDRVKTF